MHSSPKSCPLPGPASNSPHSDLISLAFFFFLGEVGDGQAEVQPTLSSACPWENVGEQAGGAPSRVLLIILAFSNAGRNNEL